MRNWCIALAEAFQADAYLPGAWDDDWRRDRLAGVPAGDVAPQCQRGRRALQRCSSVLRCAPRKTAHTQHFKALRA